MRKIGTAALILIAAATLASGCRWRKQVRGNGVMITSERQVKTFSQLTNTTPFDVELTPAGRVSVTLQGDENLVRLIQLRHENRRLYISLRPGYNIRGGGKVKIKVAAPELNYIATVGSGDLTTNGTFESDKKIEIKVAGSGTIRAWLDAPEVESEITGSGDIYLEGKTRELSARILGSGNFNGYDMLSEMAEVKITGSGNAHVFASMDLDAKVLGSGDIRYRGEPAVKKSVHGSGKVSYVSAR